MHNLKNVMVATSINQGFSYQAEDENWFATLAGAGSVLMGNLARQYFPGQAEGSGG